MEQCSSCHKGLASKKLQCPATLGNKDVCLLCIFFFWKPFLFFPNNKESLQKPKCSRKKRSKVRLQSNPLPLNHTGNRNYFHEITVLVLKILKVQKSALHFIRAPVQLLISANSSQPIT